MDHSMVKEQHHEGDFSQRYWVEISDFHPSHEQSAAHEYSSYGFVSTPQPGLPLEPTYHRPMQPLYSGPQPPQSLFTAQWPSMLTNPSSHGLPPMPMPAPAPPLAPVSTFATAHLLPPVVTTPAPASTSRRTLTDQDRRRMCQYHEDHPNVKQTEIGAMFGVERSTVSKVLRQKDKYLFPEDGSRSPIKRAKGKFPDIERALSNWARNHQRQGLPLNDNIIKEKARFFATTVGSSDSHIKVNSNSWLEKFKQKNHLMGAKPRKGSDAQESDSGLQTGGQSGSQTPNGISPISPVGVASPSSISPRQSRDNLKTESSDTYLDFPDNYKRTDSQSATSIATCFTDTTAPSSFSPQSPTSPFFSPDLNGVGSPFSGSQQSHMTPVSVTNAPRTRSQTFPMLAIEPNFGNTTGSGDALLQREVHDLMTNSAMETPIDEYPDRSLSMSSAELHISSQPPSTVHSPVQDNSPSLMAPPPNPILPPSSTSTSNLSSPVGPPSQDEARRALELVMNFFQSQPSGAVDPQEYITMGKLMEKLKMQGSVGELPGGMHSIDFGQQEMSRKRSIHSL